MKKVVLLIVFVLSITSLYSQQEEKKSERLEKEHLEIIEERLGHMENTLQTLVDNLSSSNTKTKSKKKKANSDEVGSILNKVILSPIIIGCIFSLLVAILPIFLVLFFRHRNKKAKYMLAEKILESGGQIPDSLFQANSLENSLLSKGIKNICIGIALFIFLWALTDILWLACVGLFNLFTGIGEVIIYLTQEKPLTEKSSLDNDFTIVEEGSYFKERDKENKKRGDWNRFEE